MAAYTTRLPAGIPGMLNRTFECTVEAGICQSNALPIAFGVPVTVDATTRQYRGLTTGDAATAIIAFITRPYPTASTGAVSEVLNAGGPSTLYPTGNFMKRGYMTVLNNNGTCAKGNPVYCRVATPSGAKVIGGVEAASDTTNTVQVPNCYFTGPADSMGNVEIAFNL